MGYRLEITKSKKNDGRIDIETVEALIASVNVISEQLSLVKAEVEKRDDLVIALEEDKVELNKIIANLSDELQGYINNLAKKEEDIEQLKSVVKEQQERIEERNSKIKRLEEEAQERYEDNCKLKDRLVDLLNERNDLERKLNIISGVFKNDGDDK